MEVGSKRLKVPLLVVNDTRGATDIVQHSIASRRKVTGALFYLTLND